jgi:hypothetical protein
MARVAGVEHLDKDVHMNRLPFPPWIDRLLVATVPLVGVGLLYAATVGGYAVTPLVTNVGYAPKQPVPYSHALHVGQLKMDCRYCHNTVDKAAYAAIPPTVTCLNCHSAANSDGTVPTVSIHANSRKLLPVRESQASGQPILWEKIHDLPDYVYFNHRAHVNRDVGCVSCHGRVDKMEVVHQAEPLTMTWCLNCHRHPEPHLRLREHITDMEWQPDEAPEQLGARLRATYNISPSTSCSTCHR